MGPFRGRARARRAEGAFLRNAQVTRLLIGDELGDALDLPFDLPERRAAKRSLLCLRIYGLLCTTPVLGRFLAAVHRVGLRAMQRFGGEFAFPLIDRLCQNL